MNILATLRERFAHALREIGVDAPAEFAAMVKPAQDARFGDFQANCAMPLGKRLGKPPREVAAEIVARLDVADLCGTLDPAEAIAGPGFINLRIDDGWLEERINELFADERLGVPHAANPRKVVVDYSAPNVAKPMHVGHLRSTVIGDAICRILRFLGHDVTGDNHVGDWGTQFGMILFGYKHFRDDEAYRHAPVAELARLYRLVSRLSDYHEQRAALPELRDRLERSRADLAACEANANPADKSAKKALKERRQAVAEQEQAVAAAERKIAAIEGDPHSNSLAEAHRDIAEQARRETAKLHAGDAENLSLWNEFVPQCLDAIQSVYDRLDIRFDTTLGESHFQPMLAKIVADLLARGIAQESDGAICVFVEGHAAPFIVRKSDGAFTYATTDLATIRHRVDELGAEEILYVVDARQSEHFQLLFATAEKLLAQPSTLDPQPSTLFRHVSFGTVLGDDRRPFKTRSGDTVGLESLIDEAVNRARAIVDANDDAKPDGPELDEATRADVAEAVGVGGIKYADLRHNRDSDYVFSWEKMLATTGDTATYMQYAHARVCGIFRKGNVDRDALRAAGGAIRLSEPAERALALQLARFPEALDDVVREYRPNALTQYLFETANSFSTFFEQCHVLRAADEATRASRLLLCDLTARVMHHGLALLGIRTCERM
ncbi:MAG: arginine--tRNA ligase [Planctomycetaceae bacterium]